MSFKTGGNVKTGDFGNLLERRFQLVSLGFSGIHQLSIKKWIFLIEGVFFLLTSPLMGDPYLFPLAILTVCACHDKLQFYINDFAVQNFLSF